MPLPSLIVIGAHKCGTTSMHDYLDQHPEISMSRIKELNFFVDCMNWKYGLDWYESQFEENKIIGESSVMYSRHPRGGGMARRIHETLPDAKLIYMVRDPIDRIASHYVEIVDELREMRTFDEVVSTIGNEDEYLGTSLYFYQLSQYLKYFDRDRILVLFLEELKSEPQLTMRRAFQFLEVDASVDVNCERAHNAFATNRRPNTIVRRILPKRFVHQLHRPTWMPGKAVLAAKALIRATGSRMERPRLTEAMERRLIEHLRDDVRELQNFLGRECPGWRDYS